MSSNSKSLINVNYSLLSKENNFDMLKKNLQSLEIVTEKYFYNPQPTDVNNLNSAEYKGWFVVEQNEGRNSSLAKMKRAGIDVANIMKNGNYYGTILNKNIYVNENFVHSFTSFENDIDIIKNFTNVLRLRPNKKVIVGGIKIIYVTDTSENTPFVMYWSHTKKHFLILADKLPKFLKLSNDVA